MKRPSILEYINNNTHRATLEEKTTKEVAAHFGLDTKITYEVLSKMAAESLITKLSPVNEDNFSCCGWVRNND